MAKGETYEEFVAKFKKEYPKTTDDCYTPREMWELVENYAIKELKVEKSKILRPFYPGGDFEKEDYSDAIVVDNPPFSIISKIVKFYLDRKIPFVLFAPGNTFCSLLKRYKVAVVCPIGDAIYENGAKIRTVLLTNLKEPGIYSSPFRWPKKKKKEFDHMGAHYSAWFSSGNAGEEFFYPYDDLEFVDRYDNGDKIYGGGVKIKGE